jgi:hypothetical protein
VRQLARALICAIAMSASTSAIAQTSDVPANASRLVELLVSHQVFESLQVEGNLVTVTAGAKLEYFASAADWDRYCRWAIAKARASAPAVDSGRIVHPAGLVLVQCSR